MIRKSVRDLVELCQYVTDRDEAVAKSDTEPIDSFRKLQWKRRREAERLALPKQPQLPASTQEAPPLDATDDTEANVDQLPEQANDAGTDDEDVDAHPMLRFEEFLDEFIASELDVNNIQRLPAKSSDPLGVISTPTRREGYSLTLARFESTKLLVVFGGRQLRDLTNLLPVASSVLDPLKLERVRYVFSNGVYAYDCTTTLWTLHQCTGRYPKERSDHSAVFVSPHFLIVFGGRGRSGMIFNDMFVLSLQDWHWTELSLRSSPSARYWHGSCVVGEHLYIFGGKSEVNIYGDLQQFPITKGVQALLRLHSQRAELEAKSPDQASKPPPDSVLLPLSWTVPHVVGKAPSPRFGLRMLRIDHDRIAFVGGWRAEERDAKKSRSMPRAVDVRILDTTTMVWTKPRFSSHICRLSVPPARFHFECFYTQQCIVVTGGFTYQHNGETESYSGLPNEQHIIYKLDLHRMIWRRQVVEADEAALLYTQYPHFSSNAVVRSPGEEREERTAFTCSATGEQLQLQLTKLKLHAKRKPRSNHDQEKLLQ